MSDYDGMLMGFLDNDFYKLTMQQVVLNHFPDVEVEYEFRCRNKDMTMGVFLGGMICQISEEIMKMKHLKLTHEEKEYLKTIPFLKDNYITFLEQFRYTPEKHVFIEIDKGELAIKIKGNWPHTILYEVPILAIISEIATKSHILYDAKAIKDKSLLTLQEKIDKIRGHKLYDKLKLADFGTRRRATAKNQQFIVRQLKEQLNVLGNGCFIGTSNIHLARIYDVKVIGTQAHEILMAGQALFPILNFQEKMLDTWVQTYDGNLGIALTDTINMDSFLKAFSLSKAKLFNGCRHDSGDPFTWCEKLISHYTSLNINPKTKQAVFSDGLTIDKAFDILEKFHDSIQCSFGIGTHLTNDVGIQPASIVIKMQKCNGFPVAKISDEPEKAMCQDKDFLAFLKTLYKVRG